MNKTTRMVRRIHKKIRMKILGRQLIGWTLIYAILLSDVAYAMKSSSGAPMGEEAATSSSSHFSSRRRLVDTDEVEEVLLKEQEQPLVVENTCSVTPAQFHSDLKTQTQAQSTRTGSPEEPRERSLINKEEHLSSKERLREDLEPTQNKSSSTNLAATGVSPKRFRSDISTLSEVELASSAEQRVNHDDASFNQFLMMLGMNDLDSTTHRSLAELWTLETSWRGTVRWTTLDSLLQKCGYVVGIRARNVLTLRQPPEGLRCDRPLWVSGGSIPLLSQNNRRAVHFIDGLRQGTELVIFRGLHLGITALAGYQLYEWLHQPPSLICHVSEDTSHTLRGLIDFYRSSDDNVLLSVFHSVLDPSNPALSYLKYGLLTPFAFGLVKGGLNTRKNHMTPEEVTAELEKIQLMKPSFYNDFIRWFFPSPPIDQVSGTLIKNLLWNGDLDSSDLQRIVDTFTDLATSARFYTSIHALGYLASFAYGLNFKDLHTLSQRKIHQKNELIPLLPDRVERIEHLQEEGERREKARAEPSEFAERLQKRLELKAKAAATLEALASFSTKDGTRKSLTTMGTALYAQYLLWSLGLSRSRTEALAHSLFKGGKLYVQVKLLQTIIDSFLKAEQCPQESGVTLAGVQPWATDLSQSCFDAYVSLFNVIPGQPTDTLVGNLTQYYFPNCAVSLDLSNKDLDWHTIYNITKVFIDHNITIVALNLSGNVLGSFIGVAEVVRRVFSTLRSLTSLDLSNNQIGFNDEHDASGTMALGKGIGELEFLTSLDLSQNWIGEWDGYNASGTAALGERIGRLGRSLIFLNFLNNQIGDGDSHDASGTMALGKGIGALKTLTFLNLSNNEIGSDDGSNPSGTMALGKGIDALESLTFLDVSNNYIGFSVSGAMVLGQGMSALKALTFLDLSKNEIGSDDGFNASGTMALGKGIEALKTLTSLDLSHNDIGLCDASNASGTVALGKGIEELRNLTILDLSNNEIGCNDRNGTDSFFKSISFLHKLQSLGFIPQRNPDEHPLCLSSSVIRKLNAALNYTKVPPLVLLISSEDVETYCETLPVFVQIVNLSTMLYYSVPSAIQALMTCLKNRPQLTSLDLSHNGIGYYDNLNVSGTVALGEGIGALKALTSLNLSNNWIGGEDEYNASGTVALEKGIGKLKALTSLNLSNNWIGEYCNSALGEGIGALKALTSLDLSNNGIGGEDEYEYTASGTVALGKGIGTLKTLTFLDLSNNEIGSADNFNASGTMALGKGVGVLKTLTFLDLSHNGIGYNDNSNASGTMALGEGIGALKTLTFLDLSNNEIGSNDGSNASGTIALGEGIENLSALKNLNLANNALSWSPSLIVLANALNSTRNLVVLNLGDTQIGSMGPDGPAILFSILPNLPNLDLSKLDVSGMTNISWTSAADVLQQLHSQQLMTACQNSRCFGGDVNPSSQGGDTGSVRSPQGRRFAANSVPATPFQDQQVFAKRKSLLNVPESDVSAPALPPQLVRQPLLRQGNATLAATPPASTSTRLLQEQGFDPDQHQRRVIVREKDNCEPSIGFASSELFLSSAAKGAVTSVIPDIVSDVFEASGYSQRISKGMATLAQLEIVAYTAASIVPTLVGTTVRIGLDWLGAPARASLVAGTTASIATGVLASGGDFDQAMLVNTTIALAGSYVGSACALKAKDWAYSLWHKRKTRELKPA